MALFIVLVVFTLVTNSSSALRLCSQIPRPNPWFLLIRTCSVSPSPPLDKKNLQTVEECEEFAVNRKALAFNFVNPDKLQSKDQMTCIIYECQELDPFLMDDSSVYDYYGVYRDLDPNSNITCVPGLGMYHLHVEAMNYSEARRGCEEESAQLARVTSALQTNKLSLLVATLGRRTALQQAYVGLHDIKQEGFFFTVEEESLNCFNFRGWAPGHPRHLKASEDCVVLDSRQGWRTVDCSRKLPFLCELVEPVPVPICGEHGMECRADAEANRRSQRQEFQQCDADEVSGQL